MAQSQSIIEFPSKLTEKEVGRSGIAALQELRERRHRSDSEPVADMEKLEQEMHALFVAEEHEALGPDLHGWISMSVQLRSAELFFGRWSDAERPTLARLDRSR